MKKGFVFTLDAIFALYLFLILSTTFVLLHEAPAKSDDYFTLSRLARDAYEVRRITGAPLSYPQYLFDNSCNNAGTVGSEAALEYDVSGTLKLNVIRVCQNG